MGIFDWKHWGVILVVVVLIFGTKKLKGLGEDLGSSIKGFKKAMEDNPQASPSHPASPLKAMDEPPRFTGTASKID